MKSSYQIFLEDYEEELPLEPYSEDFLAKQRIHRVEMTLNQEELYKEKLRKLEVTFEEEVAVMQAAYAVIEYAAEGKLSGPSADEIIMEVCPDDLKRQCRLLSAVVPMARHLSATSTRG